MRANDMPAAEFRRFGYEIVDWIADYLDGLADRAVFPDRQPGELVDALPKSAPEAGEPMDRILADFRDLVVPGLNHWNHPSFHAFFSVSASGPGILAEMLASAINTNGMLWRSCPSHVELEQVTMDWLRQWMGLPDAFFGEIFDTASTSTLHAIAAARVAAEPKTRSIGASPNLVLYTSEHAHSSVEKGAISLGCGQDNVRKIATDEKFRMRMDALEMAIEADLAAGLRPFCVVSTIGTTSVTSVDPVAEIQELAEREGLWHHVDAAYGGPAALLPECAAYFDGMANVDSVVVNPHKWLFTPIDCSAFFCRHPNVLRQAFSLVPSYLSTAEGTRAVNYMDYGIALGRRFRALKLWFVMRYFGRERISQIIRSHNTWAQELAAAVAADPRFELSAPVLFSLVVFRFKGSDSDNQQIIDAVNRSGASFLAASTLNGRTVLRLAIGNIGATRDGVFHVWDTVRASAPTPADKAQTSP